MRTPNAEHLEAMTARGWTWDPESRSFLALGARDRQDCPVIGTRVSLWDPGEWVANYGVPGIGYGTFKRHATPIEAAEEAEAWLREVLAPFRFAWLRVEAAPTTTQDPR
jgi:hypothetical protein